MQKTTKDVGDYKETKKTINKLNNYKETQDHNKKQTKFVEI